MSGRVRYADRDCGDRSSTWSGMVPAPCASGTVVNDRNPCRILDRGRSSGSGRIPRPPTCCSGDSAVTLPSRSRLRSALALPPSLKLRRTSRARTTRRQRRYDRPVVPQPPVCLSCAGYCAEYQRLCPLAALRPPPGVAAGRNPSKRTGIYVVVVVSSCGRRPQRAAGAVTSGRRRHLRLRGVSAVSVTPTRYRIPGASGGSTNRRAARAR
jgi:hypothetical protein